MDTTIKSNLLPGEEILWVGQPQIPRGFNFSNLGTSVFGVIWLAFSLFWTGGAFLATRSTGAPDIISILFPLFGLPFVFIGIYMVFIWPSKQKNKNKRTFYYITNKRIIINADTPKSPSLKSVFINDLDALQIARNADDTGNIMFGSSFADTVSFQGSSISASNKVPAPSGCFYRVENADDVYSLILMRQELGDLRDNQ